MAVQEVEILQVDTSGSQTSIRDLKREIKDLKGQLLGLEQGTKEYNDVLLEVANKTHDLKEMQEEVARSSQDFGDQLGNAQRTLAGMSGAFQAVLGALSLMGVEMGDDIKMLKMLQSAMAITQGVAAIDAGVKSFKALTIAIRASSAAMSGMQKALVATGIGAAAVAVGVLVSKLSELKAKQDEAAEAAARHNKELQEQLNITNLLAKAEGDYYTDQYRNLGIVQALEKKLADNRAYYQEEYRKGNISQYELDQKLAEDRNTLMKNAGGNLQRLYKDILAHNSDEEWKYSAEGRKVWNDYFSAKAILAEGDAAQQKALMQEWEQYTISATKNVSKARAAATQAVKTDDKHKGAPNAPALDMGEINEAVMNRERLEAETEYQQQRAAIIIEQTEDTNLRLIELDQAYRDQRESMLRTSLELGLITQEEFDNQLAELEVEASQLQVEHEQEVTEALEEEYRKRREAEEKELKKQRAAEEAWARAVDTVVGSVSGILSSLGSTLEQGSKEWKAVMTAEAIISTIKGGIDAYMGMIKTIPGVAGIVAGAAAAAATVAAGMAEVYKIQNTEISSGSSASASSATSLGSVSSAAVLVNATQVTNTRTVQTADDIAELPEQRVYVLEGDITRAQQRRKVTVDTATY